MIVIGITGPTGAGKTTALKQIEKLEGQVIDADAVYHELLDSNTALQNEIRQRFGDMTGEDGRFDRKKLGAVVFQDEKALEDLNQIAHRYVVPELEERLAKAKQSGAVLAAIDAYGLFESGCDKLCQEVVAVLAPQADRISRIMKREDLTEEYAKARVAAQHDDFYYLDHCQQFLINDCATEGAFGRRARSLFESILGKQAK